MSQLPDFIVEALRGSACARCHAVLKPEDVIGFGLSMADGTTALSISVRCRGCHSTRSLFIPVGINLRSYVAALARMAGLRVEDTPVPPPVAVGNRLTSHLSVSTDGVAWADQRAKVIRLLTDLKPLGILLKWERQAGRAQVLGGYQSGNDCVILYRSVGPSIVPSDHLGKLGPKQAIYHIGFDADALTIPDWPRFAALKVGQQFRLHGRTWTKLSTGQLRRRTRGMWTSRLPPKSA